MVGWRAGRLEEAATDDWSIGPEHVFGEIEKDTKKGTIHRESMALCRACDARLYLRGKFIKRVLGPFQSDSVYRSQEERGNAHDMASYEVLACIASTSSFPARKKKETLKYDKRRRNSSEGKSPRWSGECDRQAGAPEPRVGVGFLFSFLDRSFCGSADNDEEQAGERITCGFKLQLTFAVSWFAGWPQAPSALLRDKCFRACLNEILDDLREGSTEGCSACRHRHRENKPKP